MNPENKQGQYILYALQDIARNGDVYTDEYALFKACQRKQKQLSTQTFAEDLRLLVQEGHIHREGTRLYEERLWRYEQSAARSLASILKDPVFGEVNLPETVKVGETALTREQWGAVHTVLINRLSLILGGAGTGKTTLIRAICAWNQTKGNRVLAAPTGKAARNLTARTGLVARTVHSALGMHPDEDFLAPVVWDTVDLVVVDEASMVTLEMLAGILHRAPTHCRVILLGDYNQLPSVGAGNVLPDLLSLGVPSCTIETIHRQEAASQALSHNAANFQSIHRGRELHFDESFRLLTLAEAAAKDALCEEAARLYLAGEDVQVLSPFNSATELSVQKLNAAIQTLVNPPQLGRSEVCGPYGVVFRDGDRVMITENDRERNCSNGDIGTLQLTVEQNPESGKITVKEIAVLLPDGRRPAWPGSAVLEKLTLAYAITVHKSQGSEYDTVLLPVIEKFQTMLYRNLVYTALTRAKKEVLLFGDPEPLDTALQRPAPPRKSMLVAKTRMARVRCV